jgi:cation diffusion facilitator CzcD-associated flavoprotein CzcO
MTNMSLKSKDGIDIKDVWSKGLTTYLGLQITGFPNAFMVYSPQCASLPFPLQPPSLAPLTPRPPINTP